MTLPGESNTGRAPSSVAIERRASSSTAATSARLAGPEPLDALELLGLGAQQAGEAAERCEQLLGELEHAGARQAGAQQQRDQLGVGERRRAEGEQLFARSCGGGDVLEHGGAPGEEGRLVKSTSV